MGQRQGLGVLAEAHSKLRGNMPHVRTHPLSHPGEGRPQKANTLHPAVERLQRGGGGAVVVWALVAR